MGDFVAVAVADGHGTSRLADVGARLAVEVALAALARFADGLANPNLSISEVQAYALHPLRVQLVRDWVDRVRARADAATAPLVDYGSTLVFSLWTPRYTLLGQLGDGDVLLVHPGGSVESPLPADPRAFADETPSLCQQEAWHSLRVRVMPPLAPGSLLILATDGYSKSYASDEVFRQIGPDYLGLIEADGFHALLPHIPAFLQEITARGAGDDIALALLYWPVTAPADKGAAPVASEPKAEPVLPAALDGADVAAGEAEASASAAPVSAPESNRTDAVLSPANGSALLTEPLAEGLTADRAGPAVEESEVGREPPSGDSTVAASQRPPDERDRAPAVEVVAIPDAATPVDDAPVTANAADSTSDGERGAPTPSQPTGGDDARVSEDG